MVMLVRNRASSSPPFFGWVVLAQGHPPNSEVNMAVQMCNPAIVWEGLSTDVKPTPSALRPLTIGNMFYETNTFYTYMWNGVAWVGPVYWTQFMYPWDEYANGY